MLSTPEPEPEPQPVNRFDYDVPGEQAFRNQSRSVVALSPDGRHFVYNTVQGLYLRTMGELEARLIPGTEAPGGEPFFSPDGQSIAYFLFNGEMKRISINGGAAVTITDVGGPNGASWGPGGTILYGQAEGIYRVSANGGMAELSIPAEERERLHGPELLPDGTSLSAVESALSQARRWNTLAERDKTSWKQGTPPERLSQRQCDLASTHHSSSDATHMPSRGAVRPVHL